MARVVGQGRVGLGGVGEGWGRVGLVGWGRRGMGK